MLKWNGKNKIILYNKKILLNKILKREQTAFDLNIGDGFTQESNESFEIRSDAVIMGLRKLNSSKLDLIIFLYFFSTILNCLYFKTDLN